MDKEPEISVGIVSGQKIDALLHKPHRYSAEGFAQGPQTFTFADGKIAWQGMLHDSIEFEPTESGSWFEIADVTIGINFHWERKETQRFAGKLRLIVEGDKLTVVNVLPVEEYLMSVISSEMSATASPEFLKAHAVISRSWLLAQIQKNKRLAKQQVKYRSMNFTDTELIRWYDREDHVNFDVCADDHCQRYQGVTRQTTPTVREAIEATRGCVLVDENNELCDARFSKCCGGVFEEFENCWEPVHFSYLRAQRDSADELNFPDLRNEENAREWILTRPDAYCNTDDAEILGQVLNNYDQETQDFYRWTVTYSQAELSELIRTRSGIDFGDIKALEPVERGTSGRLVRLRIVGTKKTLVIGKELEIRRTLSTSHLYSSAFVVEPGATDAAGLPESFTLRGAGWGHGVGLCQIGAAVMGAKGMEYRRILLHYFPGASIVKSY
ncbi:MAG: SpoIID/LytB domain-containing protein [Muribaculaceae bacterium]|nr:SpoIID/LytB domain-containing protein [Muribaculaceae bacterium]